MKIQLFFTFLNLLLEINCIMDYVFKKVKYKIYYLISNFNCI